MAGFAGSASFLVGGASLAWIGLNNEFPLLQEIFVKAGDTPQIWVNRAKGAPLPVALVGLCATIGILSIVDESIATGVLWLIIVLAIVNRTHILKIAGAPAQTQTPVNSNQGTVLIAN